MTATASTTGPGQAKMLREAMTDKLLEDGRITSPAVEAAFRTVPRELFSPGSKFSLETIYNAHEVLRLKRAGDGTVLSSVSAPWIQAKMIAQAAVEPCMRVLEIGSGGYNAGFIGQVACRKIFCRLPVGHR